MLTPKGNWVLVEPEEVVDIIRGGIIIPALPLPPVKSKRFTQPLMVDEKLNPLPPTPLSNRMRVAKVLAVGEGRDLKRGKYPVDIYPGDRVIYREVADLEFYQGGEGKVIVNLIHLDAVIS